MMTGEKEYLPRLVDSRLDKMLGAAGAVLVEGPRACGKTMTGLHHSASAVAMDDPSVSQLFHLAPHTLLDGESPRLVDEWQVEPDVWNMVRRRVDASAQPGRFILTGSSVPADDLTRHTGAGRFLRLQMHTMTWYERSDVTETVEPGAPGGVSLAALFGRDAEGEAGEISGPAGLPYERIVEVLCRSGFPGHLNAGPEQSQLLLEGYLDEVIHTDLARLADIRLTPEQIREVIRSLAHLTASEGTFATIAADVRSHVPGIEPETVSRYVALLQRLFVVDPLRAWSTSLRSRATLRTSDKWHLADPALAVAALGATTARLAADPETVGFLFESAVVHDLRVFARILGGDVYHYRDSNKHEIDVIVALKDGSWGAVEVKLGAHQIEQGAHSLAQACAQIHTPPVFRLVVTGTGPTARLADGTITCPLNALRP